MVRIKGVGEYQTAKKPTTINERMTRETKASQNVTFAPLQA